MTEKFAPKVTLLSLVFVVGCIPTGTDDLRAWMLEQRAITKPKITPLTEPKKYNPEIYSADSGIEPFNQLKLTQALRRDSNQISANASLIAPEMARRKEALEAFPLDTMAMVGSLNKSSIPTALVKIGGLLYQVRIGNYLGQNYGKITKITENQIELREIVQDATGDWIERVASLDLQEGKK